MKNKFISILTYILIFFNSNLLSDENNNVLKVGLLAPLSGEYKELGNSLLYSLQLALNEINDRNVFIIPRDSGSGDKKKLNIVFYNLQGHKLKESIQFENIKPYQTIYLELKNFKKLKKFFH